jgi:hypothetical protein
MDHKPSTEAIWNSFEPVVKNIVVHSSRASSNDNLMRVESSGDVKIATEILCQCFQIKHSLPMHVAAHKATYVHMNSILPPKDNFY